MGVLARSVAESYPRWTYPRSTWQRLAACHDRLEVFFPEDGRYTQARAICRTCLVSDACRRFVDRAERGLPAGMVHGMFAGEAPSERVARRRG